MQMVKLQQQVQDSSMKLKVVSSGSVGNSYIVYNDDEALIIECGVRFKFIKEALNFNLAKVVGCLVSHSHLDHSKSAKDVMAAGINIHCLPETAETFGIKSHRISPVQVEKPFKVGGFKVVAFPLQHNVPCVGFLIEHKETGRFCFITDTCYCEYVFPGMANVIVEANYCRTLLSDRYEAGLEVGFLRDRIIRDHMSLETTKEFLKANDLARVNNILLIHLSDRNAHAERFKEEITSLTGCNVNIASKGLEIDFSTSPF